MDPAHAPTLECISSGMAAFDSGDFASAEVSFARATRFAAEGACPGPRAVRKCRSYALASRLLRHAATLAAACARAEVTGSNPGTETTRTTPGPASAWSNPSANGRAAAAEISRVARHLAALPLDVRHRATILRFAAVWNIRAGHVAWASGALAAAAKSEDARRGEDASAATKTGRRKRPPSAEVTRRCAAAAAAGLTPFGPARYAAATPAEERPGRVCAATLRTAPTNAPTKTCRACRATHLDDALVGEACAACGGDARAGGVRFGRVGFFFPGGGGCGCGV